MDDDDGEIGDDVELDDGGDDGAPICPSCGVTALPSEGSAGSGFVCENPDCEAFGEAVVTPTW